MSLLKSIGKFGKIAAQIGSVIPGPWTPAALAVTGALGVGKITGGPARSIGSNNMSLTSLPAILTAGRQILPKILPKIRQVISSPGVRSTVAGTTIAYAAGRLFDENGNEVRKRSKRMNVLNPQAARRAIRRIKGVRKMCQSIEKQLPRQKARAVGSKKACR